MTIKQRILAFLNAIPRDQHEAIVMKEISVAFREGRKQARVEWRLFPMPFNGETLRGGSYGTFITPHGFGTAFGECNVPAPGPNGYEQRAFYVNKDQLDLSGSDLQCYRPEKFDRPQDSTQLVPVIVTVLR